MFEGHQFIKLLNDNWVLDITEFIGYKVKLGDNREVMSYKEAFPATVADNEVSFDKNIRVPIKVLKEAANIVLKYQQDYEKFQQRKGFYI